jgi:hypothetical protein
LDLFACTTTSMLSFMMLDFWCEGASSISFHPRLVLSLLPHPAYHEQQFYSARHVDQAQRLRVTSFTSPLTILETASHEAGRSWESHLWVSHIINKMRRMKLDACRSLSTCRHTYDDFYRCVHVDDVLFDYPEGPPCGSHRGPSVLVSMVSMITVAAHHIHVCLSGRSAQVLYPRRV